MVEHDFIVLGTETGKDGIPVALLARPENGRLAYAGKAMISMSRAERDALHERLTKLRRAEPPLASLKAARGVDWVTPELGVKVRHLKGTGGLRHASVREILEL